MWKPSEATPIAQTPGKSNEITRTFRTAKAKKRLASQFKEGPLEILEGYWSTDPKVIKVKKMMADEGTKKFFTPGNPDEYGRVTGNGFRSNLQGLRYVPGYGQIPATWPLTDNRLLRETMGLVNEMPTDWRGNIIRATFRLFFQELEPQPLKLRKGSSTMWPYYETDVHFRQELVQYALSIAEDVGTLLIDGKFEEAFESHGWAMIVDAVYRLQSSDKVSDDGLVPAERMIADLEYALTGGRKGSRRASDRSFDQVDEQLRNALKNCYRQRKRTAFGMTALVNYILMPVAQSVRQSIYRRYDKTLHHTTRHQLQDHLGQCYDMIAADVSQHDQVWPVSFLMDVAREELLDMGFAPWWISIFYAQAFAPTFVTGVGPDEPNLLLGSYKDPNLRLGLSSGNAFTDILGTWFMCATYATVLFEHVAPKYIAGCSTVEGALKVMDKFLKWQLDVAIKDKSDDALLLTRVPHLKEPMNDLIKLMKSGDLTKVSTLMEVGYENGHAYLGNLILYPDDYDLRKSIVIGNPISYFVNQFAPEYGVQSAITKRPGLRRPYPGLAWGTYDDVYGSIPVYGEMKELVDRCWRDVMGESYLHFREEMLTRDKLKLQKDLMQIGSDLRFEDMSPVELEVAMDPSKLEWKYDPGQVRNEIADLSFRGVPVETIEPFFNKIVPQGQRR